MSSFIVIVLLFEMLPAVEFDDQMLFQTNEVNNIRPDNMLAPEPAVSHLTVT